MTWNYRLISVKVGDGEEIGLYEVYYDSDGVPIARTTKPARFTGETPEEIEAILGWAMQALEKPVLTDKDFPHGLT